MQGSGSPLGVVDPASGSGCCTAGGFASVQLDFGGSKTLVDSPAWKGWCMFGWPYRVCWLAFCCWWWNCLDLPIPQKEPRSSGLTMPPQAWDKRYVRLSHNTGAEVMLIRKGVLMGTWLFLFPDRTIRVGRLGDRKTIMLQTQPGIYFQPIGAILAAEKQAIRDAADTAITTGAALPLIPKFDPSQQRFLGIKRFLSVVSAVPTLGGKTLRWITRSRWRVGGTLGVAFAVFEFMEHFGVFQRSAEFKESISKWWSEVIETWSMASESFAEYAETAAAWYVAVNQVVEPWRLLAYVIVGVFFVYMAWTWEESELNAPSPASSADTSPVDSGAEDGPVRRAAPDPQQMKLLTEMAERQARIEEQMRTQEINHQQEKLVAEVTGVKHSWNDKDQSMFDLINDRLSAFQTMLHDDKGVKEKAVPGTELVPVVPLPHELGEAEVCTPAKKSPVGTPRKLSEFFGSEEPNSAAKEAQSSPKRSKTDNPVLNRLHRAARSPQATYVLALEKLLEWPKGFTEEHFPIGFRARVGPDLLAEVYSSGKRGREFATDWLRGRGLLDCNSARELISTLGAIDTLLFDAPIPDFINHVGVEKLCKKAFGLMTAYSPIKQEIDWKRPSGNNKWVTKVDWEGAKRIDPDLRGKDNLFRLREVKDEARRQIDRDAALLSRPFLIAQQRSGFPTHLAKEVVQRRRAGPTSLSSTKRAD